MRPVDVKSASAAAQHHGAASSSSTAEATETAARAASTRRTASTRSSATTEAAGLFAAFTHSLFQFVGAHAEHAYARSAAGKRNRFCSGVRGYAGDGHSGRHDLVRSIAVAAFGGGQSLQD